MHQRSDSSFAILSHILRRYKTEAFGKVPLQFLFCGRGSLPATHGNHAESAMALTAIIALFSTVAYGYSNFEPELDTLPATFTNALQLAILHSFAKA